MLTFIFLKWFLHLASQTSPSLISLTTLLLLRTLYLFHFFLLSLNFGLLSHSLPSILYHTLHTWLHSVSFFLYPQWLLYLYIQPWPLNAYSLQLIWPFTWKVEVIVSQLCLTFCDPMDCSPSGSSVHGILQASILEWVAISIPGIFLTQRSNPVLPHCGQILYHLNHHTWKISQIYMSQTEFLISHLLEIALLLVFHITVYLITPAKKLEVIHHSSFPHYLTLTPLGI